MIDDAIIRLMTEAGIPMAREVYTVAWMIGAILTGLLIHHFYFKNRR